MKKAYFFLLLIIFLFIIGCQSDVKEADVPVVSTGRDLKINLNANLQTMEGFGASDGWQCQFIGKNWPLAKRNQMADLLFSKELDINGNPKGIGLSLWRFNLGAGSAEQGENSFINDEWRRSECFLNADGTYNWNKQEGQRWFMKAAKARGVEKMLAFTGSPPVYFTQNGKAFSDSGSYLNLNADRYDDLADFWVTCIENIKAKDGVDIDYISPINEPQYDWNPAADGWAGQEGTAARNYEIYTLVSNISQKLKEKGSKSQIVLGEAAAYDCLYKEMSGQSGRSNQIDYFFGVNSMKNIASMSNVKKTISGHAYWQVWPLNEQISSRELVSSKVKTVPGLSLWETEYCIMENPGTAEIPGGSGPGRDLGMNTALWVARIISNDIAVANVTSWQWWVGISRGDYKDGLIHVDNGVTAGAGWGDANYCRNDGTIRETKILWAFGNFSFFVKPGMVRVQIADQNYVSASTDVMLTAYKDIENKKLVVVAVNYGKMARTYNLNLSGGTLKDNLLIPYTTSDVLSLKKGAAVKGDNIEIAPRSVVTFVGSYN
jgi:O-glycosyl hydrolase